MLILAYRPFDPPAQPYAETGPIFLLVQISRSAAIRGYGADGWIGYATGQIVRGGALTKASASILSDAETAYVHIRSKLGCFQCRVDRA